MTDIPVVFCFDERILLGAGVSVLSLVDSAGQNTRYSIYILHPGITPAAMRDFESLVAATRHSISFLEIPASRFDGVPKNSGSWTEIVYYRLLIAEYLSDCSRAIYSDVDVFFKRDLTEAFSLDMKGAEWAGVAAEANRPDSSMHKYFPENTNELIYFSGFMVMDLDLMRKNNAIARYFDTIAEFGNRLKFFDLDVLNIATPGIARLPFDYVVLEDIFETEELSRAADFSYLKSVYSIFELEQARDNAAIVHYAGPRGKPWQRQQVPDYYAAVVARLPRGLRRRTFRDFRKRWLSKKGLAVHPVRSA